MKKLLLSAAATLLLFGATMAQVAINNIGSPPDPSAMLDVQSTTSGLLLPRMTTSQRDAIADPAIGLTIFNTETNCIEWYAGNWYSPCGTLPPSWPTGTVHCILGGTTVNEVTNPATGYTWMDRNLGASNVASSSTDADAFGDLYQWGRLSDGHQCLTSSTTTTLSSGDAPENDNFIVVNSGVNDWRSPQNDNLWQGATGVNNPCPQGFRLPTQTELETEMLTWDYGNKEEAFLSPLRWSVSKFRYYNSGALLMDESGNYWSSTVTGSNAHTLYFDFSFAVISSAYRAMGHSVRCIKE